MCACDRSFRLWGGQRSPFKVSYQDCRQIKTASRVVSLSHQNTFYTNRLSLVLSDWSSSGDIVRLSGLETLAVIATVTFSRSGKTTCDCNSLQSSCHNQRILPRRRNELLADVNNKKLETFEGTESWRIPNRGTGQKYKYKLYSPPLTTFKQNLTSLLGVISQRKTLVPVTWWVYHHLQWEANQPLAQCHWGTASRWQMSSHSVLQGNNIKTSSVRKMEKVTDPGGLWLIKQENSRNLTKDRERERERERLFCCHAEEQNDSSTVRELCSQAWIDELKKKLKYQDKKKKQGTVCKHGSKEMKGCGTKHFDKQDNNPKQSEF